MEKSFKEFSVQVYGDLEKYNEVLSKARCRIFYKYENRNGTFISDEFAEKLLSSIAYAPIKGIYEPTEEDYTDHGEARDLGRIYGIVPENPNLAWESHLDEDGKERTYACVDVLIFTALYKEASEIVGKSQSMELYGPSLKYHEGIINNKRYIVFDEGCFLGLQVLGDKVEPCFEGASFYTLQSQIESIIYQIKQIGGTKMPVINFKLSDEEKFKAIWTLLNADYTEEGNWTVTYGITAIYDDYALVVNYESGEYERAYYTKNSENDMVEITDRKKCHILDVTDEEYSTLKTLRALNGDTYELVSDVLANAQENLDKTSEFSAKIEEMNISLSTLQTEKEALEAQIADYTAQIESKDADIANLTGENDSLKEYKLGIETQQKKAVIDEYTEQLSEEILNTYREDLSKYSAEELDMRLAYELKKSNPSVFSKEPTVGFVPKDVPMDGITAILSKYKK